MSDTMGPANSLLHQASRKEERAGNLTQKKRLSQK